MIALLYDIHGNLPALDAVIGDARSAGAERFVLGGDYAMAGAMPGECLERLDRLDADWIRGNTERWVADRSQAPDDPLVQGACAFALDALGAATAARLAGLPETTARDGVLFCHGSPASDMQTFMPDGAPGEDDLLAGDDHETVVFGHSHLQFMRAGAGRRLVNPGSVGMPFDGDRRAAYSLWDGATRFDLRRVAYDTDAYVTEVRARMSVTLGDAVETLARRLQAAAFVI